MIRVFTLIAIFVAPFAFAIDSEVTVTPEKAFIASPVTVTTKINLNEGEKIRQPETVKLPSNFKLLSFKVFSPKVDDDGTTSITVSYDLESYRLGVFELEGLEYVVVAPDGTESLQVSSPAKFEIITVRNDPETADKIKVVKGVLKKELRWETYIVPAVIALIVIIAIIMLVRKFMERRENIAPPPLTHIPKKAHEIAYEELSLLDASDHCTSGRVKEFFFALSEITRGYVERRYGVPALERTSLELEREFNEGFASEDVKQKLIVLLKECDSIKFAKGSATLDDAEKVKAEAVRFVDETRHVEEKEPT